ncbi:hypothetical protein [Streptomyces paromomycinus]|uniref:Uncharacterized protein n=1 Tax=Streptomyces paromomycinus TaxID=92743 RepID=A0A401VVB7_STREY|nr:hypothetical protein [Streptomyces paromomycinus]GCD40999.1 hypothetical protein GKJPGBOP_00652 [Streptomyces paromomycinus]
MDPREPRGGDDPHIHVPVKTLHDDAAARNLMASTFGLVSDLPSVIVTGCGLRVPYVMTSRRPDRVTCLACREHARREHLRFAAEVERMCRMVGSVFTPAQGRLAADRLRDLARQFSDDES